MPGARRTPYPTGSTLSSGDLNAGERRLHKHGQLLPATMQIRFISGLTAEEEDDLAPALLRSVTTLLDRFPLAYTLRIETSGNRVYQHSQPAKSEPSTATQSVVARY